MRIFLTLGLCVLAGVSISEKAWSYELLDLPPGAYVETSPTTTVVKFKDGSYMENTPTRVKIFGEEAMQFHFKNSPDLKNLQHIFKAEDFKSFESTPTGWTMNFVDGSYLQQTPTKLNVTPGLGAEYQAKFVKLYYEGSEGGSANSNTDESTDHASTSPAGQSKERTYHTQTQSSGPAEPLNLVNTELRHQDYSGRNLSGSRMSNVEFYDVDFSNVDFSGSTFTNVDFYNCNVTNVNFSNTIMSNVDFEDGDVRGSNFAGASLTNADFVRTKIKGVDFTRARTSNLNLDEADYSGGVLKKSEAVEPRTAPVKSGEIVHQLERVDAGKKSQYHSAPTIDLAIHFEFDSDKLKKEGWEQVSELAEALKSGALKSARFLIEGHTDAQGTDEYNMDLSYRRAGTVRRVLSDTFGIPSERLSIKGYGEDRPVATNDTDYGRAQNRRVTVVNLSKGS